MFNSPVKNKATVSIPAFNPGIEVLYADTMRKMEHLSVGIQLADEGLHKRTASFMSEENLKKVQEIRQRWDPNGVFFEWHSKPE